MNGNFNVTPIKKDENIVTTDTTQTITGQKQFTGGLYVGGGLITIDDDKEVLGKGQLVVKDSSIDMTYPLGSSGPAKIIGHAENNGNIELSVEGKTNNQSDGKTTLSIQHDRVTINNNKVATENQVNAKQDIIDATHKLSADFVDDTNTTNKFVSSTEKSTWNGKQDALVSGTNIKTINSGSVLGSGNIDVVNDVKLGIGGSSIVTNGVAEIPTETADTLSIDTTPTQNSDNLVTSGGVYSAIESAITTALNTPV